MFVTFGKKIRLFTPSIAGWCANTIRFFFRYIKAPNQVNIRYIIAVVIKLLNWLWNDRQYFPVVYCFLDTEINPAALEQAQHLRQ